jgi:DNA polymerase-3 subunit delta'
MWQVIGQDRAVALLKRSLETGSLAHAYLFVGPAHVGKMTLALELAKALNCEAGEPPCGKCPACLKIAEGKHADVQIVGLKQSDDSPESRLRIEIGIDRIRQMQHAASLPPFEGKNKVFIIDGAELLSIEAANCLLKTLEEPANRVVFILLAASEQLLPATVVSRCQRVELHPLTMTETVKLLVDVWAVDEKKAKLLARLSRGCLGWAVSAALDGQLLKEREERLQELFDIINSDIDERFVYAAQFATQFGRDRAAMQEKLGLWLDWWRDLLLLKIGCGALPTNVDQMKVLNDMAGG